MSCTISGFLNFHVSHLNYEKFNLCLQNTLNMSKTTRVYFGALQKVEDDDAETLKDLVEKEEKESTSPESYEKVKEEVVETFPEMTLWGEMHEELKNEKTIPNSEVDEYIIHLNNELRGTIVNKKILKIENQKK